ncbi:uncharacterized protein LOC144327138 isoform X2 [Podarcis muralis]
MRFLYLSFALVFIFFHVVAGQPAKSCEEQGGYCQVPLTLKCPYGYIPAMCGINGNCCKNKPPTTPQCNRLGGFCQVGLNEPCLSGKTLPANCGINAKCCAPE